MRDRRAWWVVPAAIAGVLLAGACGDHGRGDGHGGHGDGDGHEDEGHGGDHVVLSAEALAGADIEVRHPGPGRIESSLEFPGEVIVDPDRIAHITPRAAGIALEVRATLGARVAAGEVLAVIESPELGTARIEFLDASRGLEISRLDHDRQRTIGANTEGLLELLATDPTPARAREATAEAIIGEDKSRLLTAYANLHLARRTRDREEDLFARRVSAEAELLAARNAFDAAAAEYASVRETVAFAHRARLLDAERALRLAEGSVQNRRRHLHLLGVAGEEIAGMGADDDAGIARYRLRSPIDGVVLEKHLVLGESVDPSTGVFVIADLSTVQMRFDVGPADLPRVRTGMPVRLRVDGIDGEGAGTVDYLSPVSRERSRTAEARVRLPAPEGRWRPGLFGTVRVVLEVAEVPLAVPAGAVLRHEGGEILFVAEGERAFEARPVRIGRRDGAAVEVLSGVEAGEEVVVRNAFVLKAELGKAAGGHDH